MPFNPKVRIPPHPPASWSAANRSKPKVNLNVSEQDYEQLACRTERASCLSASLRASLVLTRLSSVDEGRWGHWCPGPEEED